MNNGLVEQACGTEDKCTHKTLAAREMVKWLRELAASSEDLVLLLAPTWELTTVLNLSSRGPYYLTWPPLAPDMQVPHRYI